MPLILLLSGLHHCTMAIIFITQQPLIRSTPQNDTLMHYVIDEFHTLESEYSNALPPISWGADAFFAGMAALARPESTETLHMALVSPMVDVASLRAEVTFLHESYSKRVNEMHQKLMGSVSNLLQETLAQFTKALHPRQATRARSVSTPRSCLC